MSKKVECIVVDTISSIQYDAYNRHLKDGSSMTHNKWKDYGVDLYNFMVEELKNVLGFECVLIIGPPGTGKSYGIKTLEQGTAVVFNADNKNPTWLGGRDFYGTKNKPNEKFYPRVTSYDEIIDTVKNIKKAGMLADNPVAFLLGHVDTYNSEEVTRQRLKTLGNMSKKTEVEGGVEWCFYTKVTTKGSKVTYQLDTQNSGFNNARSCEGAFVDANGKPLRLIPNDYNYILKTIQNY